MSRKGRLLSNASGAVKATNRKLPLLQGVRVLRTAGLRVTVPPACASETLSAHWSTSGGQTGTSVPIGTLPTSGDFAFDPTELESPEAERYDFEEVGFVSFAWLTVEMDGSEVAGVSDYMLFECGQAIAMDSFFGRLLNLSADIAGGVHLLQIRDYTAAEEEAFDARCTADPETGCDDFKLHVEVTPWAGVTVMLQADAELPDLS